MEALLQLIQELNNLDLVIVEGKKDEHALGQLGVDKVRTLSGKPLYQVIDETPAESEVAIIIIRY